MLKIVMSKVFWKPTQILFAGNSITKIETAKNLKAANMFEFYNVLNSKMLTKKCFVWLSQIDQKLEQKNWVPVKCPWKFLWYSEVDKFFKTKTKLVIITLVSGWCLFWKPFNIYLLPKLYVLEKYKYISFW